MINNKLMVERIGLLCKKRGISINQTEKDLGFSTGSISRWTLSMPGIDKVEAVSEYFEVSIYYIIGAIGNDIAYPNIYNTEKIIALINRLIDDTNNNKIKWLLNDNSVFADTFDILDLYNYITKAIRYDNSVIYLTYDYRDTIAGQRFLYHQSIDDKKITTISRDSIVLEKLKRALDSAHESNNIDIIIENYINIIN